MAGTLVYRNPYLYELVMLALYGRHYASRYRAVADLIPAGATVLDLCCGPAVLYRRYLRQKNVDYTGLDLSEEFIDGLVAAGGRGQVCNLREATTLPRADYVLMHASLCHFLPDAAPIVRMMAAAAGKQVIIAEPVRNLTSSNIPLVAAIGRRFTDPGDGNSARRFTEPTLDEFFRPYADRVVKSFLIPGGREKVYVLRTTS